MEISRLKIFLKVVDEGSISKAAEVLNYAQSNITARIKQLERDLGKPLLYRHSRGIRPTAAGKLLYDYGEKILQLCDEATSAINNSLTAHGTIKIGAVEEIATVKLPKILSCYSQGNPSVDIDLTIGNTDILIKRVLQQDIDGAYVVGPVLDNNIIQQYIMEDELVLVNNHLEGKMIELKSIENKKVLLTSANCLYRERLANWFKEENISLGRIMEFGSLEGLITCVKEGLGITVMAKSLFEDLGIKNEVSWTLLPEKFGKVEIVFIIRNDKDVTTGLQSLIESDII